MQTLDELRDALPHYSEERLEIFLEVRLPDSLRADRARKQLLESRKLLQALALTIDGKEQLAWLRIGAELRQ